MNSALRWKAGYSAARGGHLCQKGKHKIKGDRVLRRPRRPREPVRRRQSTSSIFVMLRISKAQSSEHDEFNLGSGSWDSWQHGKQVISKRNGNVLRRCVRVSTIAGAQGMAYREASPETRWVLAMP